tara:strand:- start:754 stop:960 length:207 start_codon:yes stop_codon:yes gene_type:complete
MMKRQIPSVCDSSANPNEKPDSCGRMVDFVINGDITQNSCVYFFVLGALHPLKRHTCMKISMKAMDSY